MSTRRRRRIVYLGWDVGAWHCDKGTSKDALVLLQDEGRDQPPTLCHHPWRGNLRKDYNESSEKPLGDRVLARVGAKAAEWDEVVLAIDTPLGWPEAFHAVLAEKPPDQVGTTKHTNNVLLRRSEQWLAEQGYAPLSAVQDLIGSQSTKGLCFLKQMGLTTHKPGVWRSPEGHQPGLTAIETYPTPCRSAPLIATMQTKRAKQLHTKLRSMGRRPGKNALSDYNDALTCALMAWAFRRHKGALVKPGPGVPVREGWIWVPRDRH